MTSGQMGLIRTLSSSFIEALCGQRTDSFRVANIARERIYLQKVSFNFATVNSFIGLSYLK